MSAPSLAAVLFTDLVDSTAQHTELGDEAADLLRRTPGDRTRADELAHQSLTTAEELGMQRVAEQARELLASD